VVALSGGVDSVALLHLLRFTPALPPLTLVAAHVDHAMRAESRADADWVVGLCRAWGVTAEIRRLGHTPAAEAEARTARYAVLEEIRAVHGADRVLTAHHADDQAETVLFRALRGTGLRGLRGIPERRAPAVWRPLLPFDRAEIVAYARHVGLSWRDDPTNAGGFARNVLRHQVLPLVERTVASGARRALRGLARRARDDEAAWRSLEPEILRRVDARPEPEGYSVDREACLGLHPAVRARVIRGLVRRLGGALHDTGTRLAVEFTKAGASGGKLSLGGGIWFRRDLERLRVVRGETPRQERPASVPGPGEGKDRAILGGQAYDVVWDVRDVIPDVPRGGSGETTGDVQSFAVGLVAFPLTVRSWRPGDRMRLAYGSKKLKKLFLEARVPADDRSRIPVLVDAAGSVLWVPGVARSVEGVPGGDGTEIHIHITHAESD
jgi:tRNA(Ile)-lysidine synthase